MTLIRKKIIKNGCVCGQSKPKTFELNQKRMSKHIHNICQCHMIRDRIKLQTKLQFIQLKYHNLIKINIKIKRNLENNYFLQRKRLLQLPAFNDIH